MQCTRHRYDENRRGAGPAELPGAFGNSAAGGEDVVNENDPFPTDGRLIGHGEGSPHICGPFCRRQVDLRLGPADTAQVPPGKGDLPLPGEDLPEQHRLVEPPLAEPFDMEGNREHQVGSRRCRKRPELASREQAEGAAELDPSVVFEAVDKVPDRALEQESGTGSGERRTGTEAPPAEVITPAGSGERHPAHPAQG